MHKPPHGCRLTILLWRHSYKRLLVGQVERADAMEGEGRSKFTLPLPVWTASVNRAAAVSPARPAVTWPWSSASLPSPPLRPRLLYIPCSRFSKYTGMVLPGRGSAPPRPSLACAQAFVPPLTKTNSCSEHIVLQDGADLHSTRLNLAQTLLAKPWFNTRCLISNFRCCGAFFFSQMKHWKVFIDGVELNCGLFSPFSFT